VLEDIVHAVEVVTMNSRERAATLSVPVLQSTVRNQRRPDARLRYEPTVVYHLAERARSRGVDLTAMEGPWRADQRPLRAPGRNSLSAIPIVTNEHTQVMVDTAEHAVEVAGLLNWCGVRELEPVPDLVPPDKVRVH
jgi:hypothetical protein